MLIVIVMIPATMTTSANMRRNDHIFEWILRSNNIRFKLVMQGKLRWLLCWRLLEMLLLVVLARLLSTTAHVLMSVSHGYSMHLWGPFCDRLMKMIGTSGMGVDLLVHTIARIGIHHDWHWLNIEDGGELLACFSHWYRLLLSLSSFHAIRHLIMVYIAKLILLGRNIGFNSGCISAV